MWRMGALALSTGTLRGLVLAATIVVFSSDLFEEFTNVPGKFEFHHIIEFAVMLGLGWLFWLEIEAGVGLREALRREREQVARLSGELDRYVEQCFRSWQLTAAEQQVAWLLLKGFSFAEIAGLRDVKEKTLRQQATSIYAKAGVSGRSELAATFLEDVMATSFAERAAEGGQPAAAQGSQGA